VRERVPGFDLAWHLRRFGAAYRQRSCFDVQATSGDTRSGVTTGNRRIVDWLAENFRAEPHANLTVRRDRQGPLANASRNAAEKAKQELSGGSSQRHPVSYAFSLPPALRDRFNIEMQPGAPLALRSLCPICSLACSRPCSAPPCGIELTAEEESSDVGCWWRAGTAMPMVQEMVRTLIPRRALPSRQSDEVVAIGAAVQAASHGELRA